MTHHVIKAIKNIAKMYGINCNYEFVGNASIAQLEEKFLNLISNELKSVTEISTWKIIIPEDVVYMLQKVHEQGGKGSFLLFGLPTKPNTHEPEFDFDEKVLEIGVATLLQLVLARFHWGR